MNTFQTQIQAGAAPEPQQASSTNRIIIDGVDPGLTKSAIAELAMLAQKHGLRFIIDEGAVAEDAAEFAWRNSHERKSPPPGERPHNECFRGFGINE